MADEPEVQVEAQVEEAPPPEPAEELTGDAALLAIEEEVRAEFEAAEAEPDDAEDDLEGEDEESKPAPARKPLKDLIAEDPELAREHAELAAQARIEAANQAVAADRARRVQEEEARQDAEFQNIRNAQLSIRTQEDAWLYSLGESDVIKERDEREARMARRREEDAAWEARLQYQQDRDNQRTHINTVRQQAYDESLAGLKDATAKMPAEVLEVLKARQYSSNMRLGLGTYVADMVAAYGDYREKLGESKRSREREVERRQTAAELGLAAPRPDMGSHAAGVASSIPTDRELDDWSWERQQAALDKDPQFFEKVARRTASASRRR